MDIRFTCTVCGKRLRVKEEYAGRKIGSSSEPVGVRSEQ